MKSSSSSKKTIGSKLSISVHEEISFFGIVSSCNLIWSILWLNSEKSENKWLWHNGGTGGYSSSMALDFNNKTGIVVLSNVSAFNPFQENIDQLCFELMKTLKDMNGVLYYE